MLRRSKPSSVYLNDFGVAAQTEVVVGAKVEKRLVLSLHSDLHPLAADDDTFGLVRASIL